MIDPLEDRLARMRPSEPPERLMHQLRAARPQPEERRSQSHWGSLLAAAAGIAAGIFLAAQFWPDAPESTAPLTASTTPAALSPRRVFTPIESRHHLVAARRVGIDESAPERPVQLVEWYWVDDDSYRGDDGSSTLRMQRARSQIVPVALETY